MDPAFGASEIWLQRVRDAFPTPVEVRSARKNPSEDAYSVLIITQSESEFEEKEEGGREGTGRDG